MDRRQAWRVAVHDLDGSNWKATAEVSSISNGSFNEIRLAVFKSR